MTLFKFRVERATFATADSYIGESAVEMNGTTWQSSVHRRTKVS